MIACPRLHSWPPLLKATNLLYADADAVAVAAVAATDVAAVLVDVDAVLLRIAGTRLG